ncbi:MAG: hypothetical protein ACMXYF_05095 [Candidatus Woesearchaeota archaeon]
MGLLLVGCAADQPLEDIVEQNQLGEDRLVYNQSDSVVQVVNDTVEVTTQVIEEVQDLVGSVPLSQWCIAGSIYSFDDEQITIESEIIGESQYEGVVVCHMFQEQRMDVEYVGEIVTTTNYFLSEDQRTVWVEVEAMGQVTKTKIDLE